MPKYICPRCGYICTQRNDMRKHFKRKKICSPVLEDISREKCFSVVLGETYENKNSDGYNIVDYENDDELPICTDLTSPEGDLCGDFNKFIMAIIYF